MPSSKWARAPLLAQYAYEADGQGRTYINPFTGEKVPSVTTALKQEDKSDLTRWACMKVAERARDRTDIVMGDPDRVVARLISAPNDFRDERAEIGTGVHATIQADFEESFDRPELDDEQNRMMDRWYEFVETYKVEILFNEFSVFGAGYAGTADLLIAYTDPFSGERLTSLTDIKTSAAIHDSHRYQLAALKMASLMAEQVTFEDSQAFDRVVPLKKRGQLPESYWASRPNPALNADGAHVLQLREGFYKFEAVENIPGHYDIFMGYLSVRQAKDRLKEAQK